jgi:hypothetical protein
MVVITNPLADSIVNIFAKYDKPTPTRSSNLGRRMPFHVRITRLKQRQAGDELALDLDEGTLIARFVEPYLRGGQSRPAVRQSKLPTSSE